MCPPVTLFVLISESIKDIITVREIDIVWPFERTILGLKQKKNNNRNFKNMDIIMRVERTKLN